MKFSRILRGFTFSCVLIFASVLFLTSCNDDDTAPVAKSKTYVLVHGAFQAAYSWNQVKAALESKGNRVVVVELPGHGGDLTNPATITMDSYKNKVVAAIQAEQEKVILVGHSMGGMVISAAAEVVPEKIERLIYIGAFVPKDGQSVFILASKDEQSQLSPLLVPNTANGTIAISDTSKIASVFCADATDAVKKELMNKYRPDPLTPFTDVVTLTSQRFGTVAKSYIRTTKDMALGPITQNQMITAAGITDVYDITSSHCPHLSKPAELTDLLVTISNKSSL